MFTPFVPCRDFTTSLLYCSFTGIRHRPAMPAIYNPNWFCTAPNINPNSSFSTFGFPKTLTFSNSLSSSLEFSSTESNPFSVNRRRRRRFVTVEAAAKSSSSDLYSVLNVSRNATLQEIKASYRKLARKVYYTILYSSFCDVVCKLLSVSHNLLLLLKELIVKLSCFLSSISELSPTICRNTPQVSIVNFYYLRDGDTYQNSHTWYFRY